MFTTVTRRPAPADMIRPAVGRHRTARRSRAVLVAAAQFLAGVGLSAVVAVSGVAAGLSLAGVRGMCPAEDSAGCVWVGPLQGNGHGAVVINPPADVER